MNSFERFNERNKKRAQSTDRGNSTFIFKGYNSTLIKSGTTELQAAVVNEQEKDSAYIYTHLNEPLTIGSIWEAKSLHLLVTEEIVVIKDVEWHKYKAELCNVELDGIWGRFIGPEERYVNVSLKYNAAIISQNKPLIILPSKTLKFGDKIVIKNRPWLVQEYDDISNPGITYYSLTPTTVSKTDREETSYIDNEHQKFESTEGIGHNINLTVPTENAYFKYNNPNIKVISRSANEIVFCLPFGVDEVTVDTKQEGKVVTTTYRA